MKVLSFIPNATHFGFQREDVYWIESDQEEFAELIYPHLTQHEQEKLDNHSWGYIAEQTTGLCTQGCLYFLANADWSKIVVERWSLPHSGLWNAGSPFRQIWPYTFRTKREFQQRSFVSPETTNLVCFSALLPEKFPDEFDRIRNILDRHGIEYRLLKGTCDI